MAKGAAIKFQNYEESVPKLLGLLKLSNELKKYDKIILKPHLSNIQEKSSPVDFIESVLKFCLQNKNPVAEVFIAEGAENDDTLELFESLGYNKLAEKYGISLIDLNDTETQEVINDDFMYFSEIQYPKILMDSFLISLPKLRDDEETGVTASMSTMLGAFPASKYSGFFSEGKSKIRKGPIKHSIHDIIVCKMPNFTVIDASEKEYILAGLPLDMDKQAAKLLGKEWKQIPYIKLLDQSFSKEED